MDNDPAIILLVNVTTLLRAFADHAADEHESEYHDIFAGHSDALYVWREQKKERHTTNVNFRSFLLNENVGARHRR